MSTTPLTGFELTGTDDAAPPAEDAVWVPAVVPGGVHESLLAAGVIDHPYAGRTEDAIGWVEERTWWYRTTLRPPEELAPDERLVLEFAGLDGVATVWLDGEHLLEHVNQHRPAAADVTDRAGLTLELLVRFTPPLRGLLAPGEAEAAVELARRRGAIVPGRPVPDAAVVALQLARPRRRKAICSWGWDFAPRIPSIGLHDAVLLRRERVAVITGLDARTTALDLDAGTASLAVTVEVDAFAGRPDAVVVRLHDPAGRTVAQTMPAAERVTAALDLEQVQPWWTHDLGEQPLYRLDVEVRHGDAVLHATSRRIGIRTIELDRSADPAEGGRRFRFLLNGTPLFARGANWVPPSMLVGSTTDERVRDLVAVARRGEMTMLRVWGGGIYERDAFYDACDELGVLVWQDFMFACFDYPSDDPDLCAEVQAEAAHQLRRLRTHPCIALWAGGNEVHAIHQLLNGDVQPGGWGWSFLHELLPTAMAEHAPGAVWWPDSPWGEDGTNPINGVEDGDRHAWEVWHGADFGAGGPTEFASRGEAVHWHRYEHDRGRFISEFGIHAAPERGTLERWAAGGSLELGSPALLHRNKDEPKDKGWALIEHEIGVPTTYRQYVEWSMACQAEGLKHGVEHYRRRQPTCSGTLVWQLNDPWPGITWSLVDHDLVPKAAYHMLQRAYRPVIATFRIAGDALELWVTSSARADTDLVLELEVTGFDGAPQVRQTVAVTAPAGSSTVVWHDDVPPPDAYAWVAERSGQVPANRRFLAPLKALPLTGTVEATRARTSATTAEVVLRSTGYSYLARVIPPLPGVVADSGYVDLRDGEVHRVGLVGLPAAFDLDALEVATFADAG